jgi:hypothetical protein
MAPVLCQRTEHLVIVSTIIAVFIAVWLISSMLKLARGTFFVALAVVTIGAVAHTAPASLIHALAARSAAVVPGNVASLEHVCPGSGAMR